MELVLKTVALLCAVHILLSAGNHAGDQLTLKDCALHGRADMKGGGTIKCSVVEPKESP